MAQAKTQHPMDGFPVRPLDFDLDKVAPSDLVWSRSSPEFAIFINALGVHVPYFERYLIIAMNKAKRHVTDPKLKRDMVALAGQEGHHARNFIAYNKLLAKRYPKIAKIDKNARAYFDKAARTQSLKKMVAFTGGYETFTFLAGLIILRNYEKWMHDSNPILKALWVWHQVEEVEHGSVAHDVNRALYGDSEWYRKIMVAKAGLHIALETYKAYLHMCRVDGYFKNPWRGLKALSFITMTLADMAWQTRPVFRKKYNPRNHPLATTKQDPIAVAWRAHENNGGNIMAIDANAMTQILNAK